LYGLTRFERHLEGYKKATKKEQQEERVLLVRLAIFGRNLGPSKQQVGAEGPAAARAQEGEGPCLRRPNLGQDQGVPGRNSISHISRQI
jgi:hypothetical protein